jgi:trimeric autotransporter adhesin
VFRMQHMEMDSEVLYEAARTCEEEESRQSAPGASLRKLRIDETPPQLAPTALDLLERLGGAQLKICMEAVLDRCPAAREQFQRSLEEHSSTSLAQLTAMHGHQRRHRSRSLPSSFAYSSGSDSGSRSGSRIQTLVAAQTSSPLRDSEPSPESRHVDDESRTIDERVSSDSSSSSTRSAAEEEAVGSLDTRGRAQLPSLRVHHQEESESATESGHASSKRRRASGTSSVGAGTGGGVAGCVRTRERGHVRSSLSSSPKRQDDNTHSSGRCSVHRSATPERGRCSVHRSATPERGRREPHSSRRGRAESNEKRCGPPSVSQPSSPQRTGSVSRQRHRSVGVLSQSDTVLRESDLVAGGALPQRHSDLEHALLAGGVPASLHVSPSPSTGSVHTPSITPRTPGSPSSPSTPRGQSASSRILRALSSVDQELTQYVEAHSGAGQQGEGALSPRTAALSVAARLLAHLSGELAELAPSRPHSYYCHH